jgi:hypothetical protein
MVESEKSDVRDPWNRCLRVKNPNVLNDEAPFESEIILLFSQRATFFAADNLDLSFCDTGRQNSTLSGRLSQNNPSYISSIRQSMATSVMQNQKTSGRRPRSGTR